MEDMAILILGAVLALLLALNMVLSFWQGRQEKALRVEMERFRMASAEFQSHAERVNRDAGAVLDKLEDVTAQQVQDWNAVQQEIGILDGRLGTVERRFAPLEPLAPLEQRVDEVPETEPDGPVSVEQEASHD